MLNENAIKSEIKSMLQSLQNADDLDAAIEEQSGTLAGIIVNAIKSATVTANPAAVTAATMSNSGGPVVAANNLISTIS